MIIEIKILENIHKRIRKNLIKKVAKLLKENFNLRCCANCRYSKYDDSNGKCKDLDLDEVCEYWIYDNLTYKVRKQL